MENGNIHRIGSANSSEIYLSVGIALSYWESSEDIIEKVFGVLCGKSEPVALETFQVAPRASRFKMILSALTRYPDRALPDEQKTIRSALKKLDKLASMRNEIAHGFVSNINHMVDEGITMEGYFLTSTLNPHGEIVARELNFRFAHNAAEIDTWREQVRAQRGNLMDVWLAIVKRDAVIIYRIGTT